MNACNTCNLINFYMNMFGVLRFRSITNLSDPPLPIRNIFNICLNQFKVLQSFYGMSMSLMHKKWTYHRGINPWDREDLFVRATTFVHSYHCVCLCNNLMNWNMGMVGYVFLKREQSYLWRDAGLVVISITRGTIYVY